MTHWLRGLTRDQLADVLQRRPDVLAAGPPRDLPELARRLGDGHALVGVLSSLSVPCLQLAEAAQALGDACTRAALAGLLRSAGPDHRADVDRVVDELIGYAVWAPLGPDLIALPASLSQILPNPLGLGPPLRALLAQVTLDRLRRILAQLGLPNANSRQGAVDRLVDYFGNAETVRSLVATAEPDTQTYLLTLARPEDDETNVPPVYVSGSRQIRQEALRWAGERGLIWADPFGFGVDIPAEVTLALRGADYRAPFDPQRPPPVLHVADADRIERDSAAAATLFADETLGLLDHITRLPVTSVKAGGIGSRELTRLAKVTGTDDVGLRLALELADAAGLLGRDEQGIATSPTFLLWRDAEPGERFYDLLCAWWALGATPTRARDEDDKVRRALHNPGYCGSCRAARVVLIETLGALPGASDLGSVAAVALWQRPLVHVLAEDAEIGRPLASVWREAERLGVIAQGSLTELGRALLVGDTQGLREQAAALLPKSADQATFGTDLTVFVAGSPSARISALLDCAADRESRGGAVTWRFSPSSVRRALDEGISGPTLSHELADISAAPLPQPLRYLIADVARRHGNVRLGAATSFIRSDDAALLAEVCVDRKLAKFGLRQLAPTVLVSNATEAVLMKALRTAGYFPVSDGFAVSDGLPGPIGFDPREPDEDDFFEYRQPSPTPVDPQLDRARAEKVAAALLAE